MKKIDTSKLVLKFSLTAVFCVFLYVLFVAAEGHIMPYQWENSATPWIWASLTAIGGAIVFSTAQELID